jgi:hypothetical protein
VLLVLPLMLLASGCSKGLVKVTGTVTLDDKPLEGAMVSFQPEDGGPPANGFTGSDGTFRLTTYSTGDGARPGDYKVTITKKDEASVGPTPSDPQSMMDAMKHYQDKVNEHKAPPKPSLPPEYSDAAKTKLKCKVPPDGTLEFHLRSSGGV